MRQIIYFILFFLGITSLHAQNLTINEKNYYETQGLNIMVFEDIYPEGHQGGIGIIQHGERVATNGDLRLEPTPGQWQPIPKVGPRKVDRRSNTISVDLWYPDTAINRKGFNPIEYPDLILKYKIRTEGIPNGIKVFVDLEKPLPAEWVGKVGFNIELYPTVLFGKTWMMDEHTGIFPRQANGPVLLDADKNNQAVPYATGKRLVIAPESDLQRLAIDSKTSDLQLLDGRIRHTNGWFVVRSAVPAGVTKNAIEWTIQANVIPGWMYKTVVHTSQVGYHPNQSKIAVIEKDALDKKDFTAFLVRITGTGKDDTVKRIDPQSWGKFLRYNYFICNFSEVKTEGMYKVVYGKSESNPFQISAHVYTRNVWQPTLEYFLPVQMCHMRVEDVYKVWHGACHLDDALMADTSHLHFDGYVQGPSTLTKYKPKDRVPGLDRGGWHDAGDDDLRVESQAGTVQLLSLAYEEFRPNLDATTIDQAKRLVSILQPDGKLDILQQIEHGVLTVLGGYESLGRAYRGIISPTVQQYVMVGDVSNQTDNLNYNPAITYNGTFETRAGIDDDRRVFTEENPSHEFVAIEGLAAAARVLKEYDGVLAQRCLNAAIGLWKQKRNISNEREQAEQVAAAIELFVTTRSDEYRKFIVSSVSIIEKQIAQAGWTIVRGLDMINDAAFRERIIKALATYAKEIEKLGKETPFGVPYKPYIWGAGWNIQEFGVQQYYLSKHFPQLFSREYMYNALNFVLGCHPGENQASFASGVGVKSAIPAYGYNRADWSYIPGGVVSGTALIRPDFPELKEFPFLWQQTEYVLGGGESNYLFLVLAAEKTLNN